ncbi:MAG: TonB-dependent receptor [Gammaproteobacteria bacterium]|nr:TonB-dependent receptor [Gammaproteobacteria bacterium]
MASNRTAHSLGNLLKSTDPFGEYDSVFSTLNLELALDWGTLTSVTGMYWYDYIRFDNFDGTNYNNLLGVQIEDQTTWSQEIRLLTEFESPLNFMVGAFYENFERDSDNAGKIAALGFDPATGFSNTWEGVSTVQSDSYSFFTQAIWNWSPQWELAAGARYTHDDKQATQQNVYVHTIFGPVLNILAPVGHVLSSDFKDDHISPEVTLTWRPNDDITVWGAYRTGYKSGGFSTNTVLSSVSTGESLIFQPEEAEGGEIGVKSTLMDGQLRFNATAYYYRFDDIQISVFDSATTSFSVDNAASAETTGLEFEALYLASQELTLRAQLGYNQGEYRDFPDASCSATVDPACDQQTGLRDLSGEPLTRSPEWQGSLGFDYLRSVSANWQMVLAGEAIYSDSYQTNTNNNPQSIQDDFWRINARIGLQRTDGRWDLSLVGRNLTNEYYQGGQADKPGGTNGMDLFGGVVRARQVILQATYRL